MRLIALGLVAALTASAPMAEAAVVDFDFEATSTTTGNASGITSLALSSGGLTMTISRPNSSFDIADLSSYSSFGVPGAWGSRSLSPFRNETSNAAFLLDFSNAISSFSVQFGDFGADTPDVLSLMAYSGSGGTGSLLASSSLSLDTPGGNFSFATGSVAAGGMLSIVMIAGTSSFPNSVYYDNMSVTTASVPEPGTVALLGLGLAGLAVSRRRRQ